VVETRQAEAEEARMKELTAAGGKSGGADHVSRRSCAALHCCTACCTALLHCTAALPAALHC
jgi:hypothetical protein